VNDSSTTTKSLKDKRRDTKNKIKGPTSIKQPWPARWETLRTRTHKKWEFYQSFTFESCLRQAEVLELLLNFVGHLVTIMFERLIFTITCRVYVVCTKN